MTQDEQIEALALMAQMDAYFSTLIAAGISEEVVMTTAMVACTQRVLARGTPTQTAAWLRGQALHVERHGAELKAAFS